MNNLRPDERASLASQERERDFNSSLKSGAKTAFGLATATAGAGLSAKILPFINEFISPELALKGINKVSPKIGALLKKGMESGLDVKDGLNFIKENFSKDALPNEPKKGQTPFDTLAQYSPELAEHIKEQVGKGRSPHSVAGEAKIHKNWADKVSSIEKKTKMGWMALIDSIFGGEQQASQTQQAAPQQMQQPQQAQGQSQTGQGQQQLMAMLQKLQQTRGAK